MSSEVWSLSKLSEMAESMGVSITTRSSTATMVVIDLLPEGRSCVNECLAFWAFGEIVKKHSGREVAFLSDRTRVKFPVPSSNLQGILAEAKRAGLDINFDDFLLGDHIVVSKKWLNLRQVEPFAALESALKSAQIHYVKSTWNDKILPPSPGSEELQEFLANGGVKITIPCNPVPATKSLSAWESPGLKQV